MSIKTFPMYFPPPFDKWVATLEDGSQISMSNDEYQKYHEEELKKLDVKFKNRYESEN